MEDCGYDRNSISLPFNSLMELTHSLEENASFTHHSTRSTSDLTNKMESPENFPIEYSTILQTSFYFLKNFNFRFLEDNQPSIKRFCCIVPAILIHISASVVHMVMLLSRQEMIQVAYMLPPLLVTVQSTLKALMLIPEYNHISAFIRELGSLWRTKITKSQSNIKSHVLWRINLYNRANYWVTACGTFQYLLSPLLETLVRRFILKQDCELLLPFASSYPLDPAKNWVIYIVVYVLQFYAMFLLVSIYKGSELIMTTLCGVLGIEFLMLKEDLSRVQPKQNKVRIHNAINYEDDEPSIEEFVKRHQTMIRLSRQLDNVFNRMIFIDLLFVGITTCAFSFAAEFSRGPTYMLNNYVAVASSMMVILYLCYYGELLTRASADIGDIAYQNLWYKGNKQYKVAMWLIIKISQKPCCLTSLKYAVVSLNLFTKVVSTTWSYFSLMNSFYSEDE